MRTETPTGAPGSLNKNRAKTQKRVVGGCGSPTYREKSGWVLKPQTQKEYVPRKPKTRKGVATSKTRSPKRNKWRETQNSKRSGWLRKHNTPKSVRIVGGAKPRAPIGGGRCKTLDANPANPDTLAPADQWETRNLQESPE